MRLMIFGLGYSATRLVALYRDRFESIVGTVREAGRAARIEAERGHPVLPFAGLPSPALLDALASATHVLISTPTEANGDPVLLALEDALRTAPDLQWIGYLSTVGVYGDFGGTWIDETAPTKPASERGKRRLEAEQAWTSLARDRGAAVQIFRLGGIYGPGQNAIESIQDGTARRIIKPDQVFNRIHVDDIAGAIVAGIEHPGMGPAINVVDDLPAPPQDVVAHAAALLGVEPPPAIPFEQANLSAMGRSFYGENKRVSNRRLREGIGYSLRFPTYREGLSSFLTGSS